MFFDVSINVAASIFRVSESRRYRRSFVILSVCLMWEGKAQHGRGSSMLPFLRDPYKGSGLCAGFTLKIAAVMLVET